MVVAELRLTGTGGGEDEGGEQRRKNPNYEGLRKKHTNCDWGTLHIVPVVSSLISRSHLLSCYKKVGLITPR